MKNMRAESFEELENVGSGVHKMSDYRKKRFDSYRFKPSATPEEFRSKAEAYQEIGRLADLEHELMEGEGKLYEKWKAEEEAKLRQREKLTQHDEEEAERLSAEIAVSEEPEVPQRQIPTQIIERPKPKKSSLADKVKRFFG